MPGHFQILYRNTVSLSTKLSSKIVIKIEKFAKMWSINRNFKIKKTRRTY